VGDFNQTNAQTFLLERCALPTNVTVSAADWVKIHEVRQFN
jgi:hypothetical protein